MSFDEIKALLLNKFGADVIVGEETGGLQSALLIAPEHIANVCLVLRDDPGTYFDFLSNLSGVDYGAEDGRFGVVYHLASIPYNAQLVLKVSVVNERSLDNLPTFPSIAAVYKSADWHEREVYDMLGIFFTNHPDMRRILLPDDWEGFPLRKDYVEAEEYKGIKIK
ncbi:NADH-quinone oxidoreductase subunit C [Mucilaginibacter sp. HMF5004]|uniref:NADH-quinone oxidoreductase subunit C n=1 Tax=Mucilaginibacter rivuli TaxID=2857527 RepID=UPI001C5DD0BC|nr:NADH-quinone oxidoreductase subunit C [Mucilaginibacter rivuli]MBW4891469.1 NADH-quinone oxidoreductase subunit C [Mucilaginibacter rivuli]